MKTSLETVDTLHTHTHTHTHTHGYLLDIENKNIGIEFLRIISMLMIVIHHILYHGGILDHTQYLNNEIAWILNIACYGAVNMYALITGYVYINAKYKRKNIIELWLEVFFYNVLFTLIFYFTKLGNVDIKNLIKAFIPITSRQYWYFSSYFCLFLFIPFINKLIKELTKYQYKKLLITYIICFSVIGLILDCFNVNRGFSFLWLSFMYILGAYIKLYSSDFRKENIIYLLYYFICVILMWLIKNIIAILTYKIFGKVFGNTLFIVYNSPFLVIAASSLLIICSRLHFKYISKIILTLSSFTFGVYLISDQIYIRQFFITNKFINYSNEPWYLMIIKILLISVLIYLICSFIDYIRKYLFKILNVSKLAEKIERSISNIITTKLNNANS